MVIIPESLRPPASFSPATSSDSGDVTSSTPQTALQQSQLTPQQKAIEELNAMKDSPGQLIRDNQGGIVVVFPANVLALAHATGAGPGATFKLVESGALKIDNGRIIYRGVDLGSSQSVENYATQIEAARQQQEPGTYVGQSKSSLMFEQLNKDIAAQGLTEQYAAKQQRILAGGLTSIPTGLMNRPEVLEGQQKLAALQEKYPQQSSVSPLQSQQPQIDVRTGKPFGVESPAPTKSELYQQSVQEQGYVKGTLAFFGGQAQTAYEQHVQKTGDYYQSEAIGNLIYGATTTAPYFLGGGVGAGLMIAGGVESFGTKAGRQRLAETKTYYEEKGYSPMTSSVFSYGQPVVEVGLGLIGLKSEIAGIKAVKEVRALEEAPLIFGGYRVMGEKGGVDLLTGIKQVGGKTYLAKTTQPFFITEKGYTLEGGRGTALSFAYKEAANIPVGKGEGVISRFEISGRGVNAEAQPKYVKEVMNEPYLFKENTIFKQEIPEVKSGVGRARIKETARAEIQIQTAPKITGGAKTKVTGKFVAPEYSETLNFFGMGKQEGDMLSLVGGKISSLTAEEGRVVAVQGKPTSAGKVKVMNFLDLFGGIKEVSAAEYKGGTSQITKLESKQIPSYAQDVLSSQMKATLKTPEKTITTPFRVIASQEQKQTPRMSSVLFPQESISQMKQLESVKVLSTLQTPEAKSIEIIKQEQSVGSLFGMQMMESPKLMIQEKTAMISLISPAVMSKETTKERTGYGTSTITQSAFFPEETIRKKITGFILPEEEVRKRRKVFSFIPVIKRREKIFAIGEETTKEKALAIGKSAVLGSLARSFSAYPTGKLIAAPEEERKTEIPQAIFRPSKKGDFIVQRARYSLSSLGEKREIQRARRNRQQVNSITGMFG